KPYAAPDACIRLPQVMWRASTNFVAVALVHPCDARLLACVFAVVGIPGSGIAHSMLIENRVLKWTMLRPQGGVHHHDVQKTAVAERFRLQAGVDHGQHQFDSEFGG